MKWCSEGDQNSKPHRTRFASALEFDVLLGLIKILFCYWNLLRNNLKISMTIGPILPSILIVAPSFDQQQAAKKIEQRTRLDGDLSPILQPYHSSLVSKETLQYR